MKGPVYEATWAKAGGSDSQVVRTDQGVRVREGGADCKGRSSQMMAMVPSARARVQARAHIIAAATICGVGGISGIVVSSMLRVRPATVAAPLVSTSPDMRTTFVGLRWNELVDFAKLLTLVSFGDEKAWLAVLVAAIRLVSRVVAEVAHET